MEVVKRNGKKEPMKFEKITARIKKLCYNLSDKVDPIAIAQKTISGLYDGVSVAEIDDFAAEIAASLSTRHPDFSKLAARIVISNLHKNTEKSFSKVVEIMYRHEYRGKPASLIADDVYQIVMEHQDRLNACIVTDRDFDYDYFGFRTLQRSYLTKINKATVERPQHMLMRVAIGIHKDNIDAAIETYVLMSQGWFTHATPTLFNAGTPKPQMSSCFLVHVKEDSISGIYDTLKNCALISKDAGGIGLSMTTIRAKGSYIRGSGGSSNGLVPMLRVYNDTAAYVDQGGNKRPGAFCIYFELWHADVEDVIELKKNTGKEENRARDLFYAAWINDEFMRRVEKDDTWSLFCPTDAPELAKTYGDEFDKYYKQYEAEGKYIKQLPARKLFFQILDSQMETGGPFMLFKDAANRKSNQNNLGTISCSNLCTEIIQYTSPEETAVCNLASLALPKFVQDGTFRFEELFQVTYVVTRNLNCVIDQNAYPIPEAERSNRAHRPIGIGVQGLADVFAMLKYPFECPEAKELNRDIFETIYFAALTASCDLAEKFGTYSSYEGSMISKGFLQFDLWNVTPSKRWDWDKLRAKIKQFGVRNSLLVAPMPTASTAQILGNTECFEPVTSNIYTRRVLSGEFPVVNRHLLKDLIDLNLWNEDMRNQIIANNGSIQSILHIPENIRKIYKTVWEISQKTLIDLAADRGAFIDQSASLNIFIPNPTRKILSALHIHTWKLGLKTGMYYLRTQPAAEPIKFTVDASIKYGKEKKKSEEEPVVCRKEHGCITCSS